MESKTNVCSIIGFSGSVAGAICGIIWGFSEDAAFLGYIFLATSVCALILSIVGTALSRKLQSGKALGIWGIVISFLSLLIFAGFFLVVYVLFKSIGEAF